ncbi:hypothetical protein [Streptomyces sp. NPDC047706]|uniref:hypothetical protein n=1 Tax=Streptomyces sp. NPDC047706 TaxID=3365486 RepID=UPI003719CC6A
MVQALTVTFGKVFLPSGNPTAQPLSTMAAAVTGGVTVRLMTESAGRPLPGSAPSAEPAELRRP